MIDSARSTAELGANKDFGAPDSKVRLQGGVGVSKDTSSSKGDKSGWSIYFEVVDDQNRPNFFLTFGAATSGKGFLF